MCHFGFWQRDRASKIKIVFLEIKPIKFTLKHPRKLIDCIGKSYFYQAKMLPWFIAYIVRKTKCTLYFQKYAISISMQFCLFSYSLLMTGIYAEGFR